MKINEIRLADGFGGEKKVFLVNVKMLGVTKPRNANRKNPKIVVSVGNQIVDDAEISSLFVEKENEVIVKIEGDVRVIANSKHEAISKIRNSSILVYGQDVQGRLCRTKIKIFAVREAE